MIKELRIGKFKIKLLPNDRFYEGIVCKIKDLNEDLCLKMVDKEDRGERYSNSSRFIYKTSHEKKGSIQFGSARAAVIGAIIEKLKPKSLNEIISVNK